MNNRKCPPPTRFGPVSPAPAKARQSPRHVPPPTRFGTTVAAAVQPATARNQAPPPTKFGSAATMQPRSSAPGKLAAAAPRAELPAPARLAASSQKYRPGIVQKAQAAPQSFQQVHKAILSVGIRETAESTEEIAEWDVLSKQYAKFIAKRNEAPLEHLKHIKNKSTLEMVQEAALSIPPVLFQCGIFAREFQNRLLKIGSISKDKIEFQTKHMRISVGGKTPKNPSIYYAGKDADYNGLKIGYDNHIFTVVRINGVSYVFDNVNQAGVSVEEFERATMLVAGNKVLGNVAGAPNNVEIRNYDPYAMTLVGLTKKVVAKPAAGSKSDFKAFLEKKNKEDGKKSSASSPKPSTVTTTAAANTNANANTNAAATSTNPMASSNSTN